MIEESAPEVTYFIQLRSAQPVRQALVREQQIEQKYDHLSDVQKKNFDGAAEKFLNQSFPEAVVVHVEYTANAPLFLRSLENSWQTVDTQFARQSMFLIVPGKGKISPLKLLVGKGDSRSFEIIFPRMLNGQPLLSPDLKNFAVEFQAPSPGAVRASAATPAAFNTRVYVEFKPAKMTFDSKFEY